ncbi:hypothetical protein WICMUC_005117 [Wickerhamomyces mucosus]|uniref:Palmitoyltransferase n=1 Tax=Wickerhamomyces mucosus TaxID=1378264 RepID=A0A9P8T7C5_9ASCO|nr:hypothetical protein WICMUC_005117 [Wickerhamomyces mucosus]
MTAREQVWFQICLSMVWISYVIAIYRSPGRPPKDFKPKKSEWRRWCKKCKNYKPERAHHCKTCKQCVLKMDHHCPWTANCVGYENMPHFVRFLVWVDYTNSYAFLSISAKAKTFWRDRNLPVYLTSKLQLTATIVLFMLSLLVLITVGALTLRVLWHILFTGRTQIESWDLERIETQVESKSFIDKLEKNFKDIYGKSPKNFRSWSTSHRIVKDMDGIPLIEIDDIIFPYNTNILENLIRTLGYPWNWILPWAGPIGNGLTFKKDQDCIYDESSAEEPDISTLPWPPDSGHQDIIAHNKSELGFQEIIIDSERVVKQYSTLVKRSQWSNDYGEKLSDFGVDDEE